MAIKYAYEVCGVAAKGQTWAHDGVIVRDTPGEFAALAAVAMAAAFKALTKGKAVYGQPSKGCSGPYRVTRMLIEEIKEAS